MKKKPFITVETENLAVPEVHIDKEDVEETTDTDDTETITYDNVAVTCISQTETVSCVL